MGSKYATKLVYGRPSEGHVLNTGISLKEVICCLPGGTQSLVVRDIEGKLYTLKCPKNPQGPNVLANEWLGSQMLTLLGLHSPRVHSVRVPANFLGTGATEFFGLVSDFIESRHDRCCFELLPRKLSPKLANADHFIGALIFDTWVGSTDRRQALYVQAPGSWFTAIFIDNGQLFGGPDWQFNGVPGTYRSLQRWLYASELDETLLSFWVGEIRTKILHILSSLLDEVPKTWYVGDIVALEQALVERAARLEDLICEEIHCSRKYEQAFKGSFSAFSQLIHTGVEAFKVE